MPGVRGAGCSLRKRSRLRFEARRVPWARTSGWRASGGKACSVAKRSASVVEEEMKRVVARGPSSLVSSISSAERKMRGSPRGLRSMVEGSGGADQVKDFS